MRTDLDHLPANKQRELERVVEILFEEFGDATAGRKKLGRILKIILYGSYARGGWVDEPHTAKGYQSDYDLLIIVNQKQLTDRVAYWAKADERLIRELSITRTLRTPVNFIVATSSWTSRAMASRFTKPTIPNSTSPSPRRRPRRSPWRKSILRSGFRARQAFSETRRMQSATTIESWRHS
jgi:predicted nucleotidyltransferase